MRQCLDLYIYYFEGNIKELEKFEKMTNYFISTINTFLSSKKVFRLGAVLLKVG